MVEPFEAWTPEIHPEAFVHPGARLIGQVRLEAGASVWPGAVLRGDEGPIVLGPRSNVQDGCVAHDTGGRSETHVGAQVTVGHRVILHGCRIDHDCIVGMGAIVMDDVEVGPWSIVGAGALLPPGKRYPEGSLIVGSPGRVVRPITDEERRWITHSWEEYLALSRRHRASLPR